jgi:hypothetical protein
MVLSKERSMFGLRREDTGLPPSPAPAWEVEGWLNTPVPVTLEGLRGRVVLAIAFQMLCPGCVEHGLPQASRVRAAFPERDLAVIGLHTVFEHHEAQGTRVALAAFLHEYRIGFPVGIDARSTANPVPRTMRAYDMRGTPTTLLIDRQGRLRLHQFGHLDDLRLGAAIATLLAESELEEPSGAAHRPSGACDESGCPIG